MRAGPVPSLRPGAGGEAGTASPRGRARWWNSLGRLPELPPGQLLPERELAAVLLPRDVQADLVHQRGVTVRPCRWAGAVTAVVGNEAERESTRRPHRRDVAVRRGPAPGADAGPPGRRPRPRRRRAGQRGPGGRRRAGAGRAGATHPRGAPGSRTRHALLWSRRARTRSRPARTGRSGRDRPSGGRGTPSSISRAPPCVLPRSEGKGRATSGCHVHSRCSADGHPHSPTTSPPIRTMKAETTTMKNTRTNRVPRETAVRAPTYPPARLHSAHHQPDLPQHGTLRHEHAQGGEVGRPVGQPRLRRGVEEVVAEQADQREHEEAARARPQGAVVEADREPGHHRRRGVPVARRTAAPSPRRAAA